MENEQKYEINQRKREGYIKHTKDTKSKKKITREYSRQSKSPKVKKEKKSSNLMIIHTFLFVSSLN